MKRRGENHSYAVHEEKKRNMWMSGKTEDDCLRSLRAFLEEKRGV